MHDIVHTYAARSVADDYFMKAYPGYSLVDFKANSGDERLDLVLEPIHHPKCPNCGNLSPKIHDTRRRQIRCAPRDGFSYVYIDMPIRRVRCPHCGCRRMETIDWLDSGSRLTNKLIAQIQLQTRSGNTVAEVAKQLLLDWSTVKRVDKLMLEYVFSEPDFHAVKNIIMDEFSIQKGHKYATAVMDADTHRVIWVCKGKTGDQVKEFFELLQSKGVADQIQSVAMDMNACFPSLVRQYLPRATVLYDSFHVLQMFTREVLVEAKKKCQAEVASRYEGDEQAARRANRVLRSSQWVLVKQFKDLTPEAQIQLKQLQDDNKLLASLYPIADLLREIWQCKSKEDSCRLLQRLISLLKAIANEFKFSPAKRFANTLKRRQEGLINVGRFGYTSCPLEGANNKIKVLKRKAYGFRDFEYFKLKIYAALPGTKATPFKNLSPAMAVRKSGVALCCFHTNSR